ncbi:sigma-54-dependent Fis family transcriptional regulator [Marichromatium sp. AB31]|uniref:sigma-54 interaction domain-containing protein n=2 Tax=unclassified Marichromatium TaxID=2618417 RepID=UPI000F41E02D|nr:sigma 54-interacting transcriptional regulator [Marichromatium sp. AB31]RNE90197.1 PAS domain S-box protein [Marichromatium sp. AB31]
MSRTPYFSSLLLAQRNPFVVIDADARIRSVNASLETTLGYDTSELIGSPCCRLDANAAEDGCRHRRFFRDLEPYVETRALADGRGEVHFAQIQGFPIVDGQGQIFLGESLHLFQGQRQPGRMIGRSEQMRGLVQELKRAAATDVSVLLQGETGSGKELAAEFLHQHSTRANGPFVVVDCTVLSEDLFESELFGHVKGAFTGAVGNKTGLLELADAGTLFLDEIGELPLSQQPKLLRALESGMFRQVGSTKIRQANVRVVSATHRDLLAMVQQGHFRQDLYYRLAVLPLAIPPLRGRRADIPELTEHLLQEISAQSGHPYRITKDALRKLLLYQFPGNIRELRNLLHLATVLSADGVIDAEAIRLPVTAEQPASPTIPSSEAAELLHEHPSMTTLSPVEAVEAKYILQLLQRHRGSRKEVAASMSISERTLYRKLKRYRLNTTDERTHSGS